MSRQTHKSVATVLIACSKKRGGHREKRPKMAEMLARRGRKPRGCRARPPARMRPGGSPAATWAAWPAERHGPTPFTLPLRLATLAIFLLTHTRTLCALQLGTPTLPSVRPRMPACALSLSPPTTPRLTSLSLLPSAAFAVLASPTSMSLSLSSLISKLSHTHLTLLSLSTYKVEKTHPKERLTPPTSIAAAYYPLLPPFSRYLPHSPANKSTLLGTRGL